jgi:amidase
MATEDWQTISARKRASNAEKIPAEWRLKEDVTSKISPTADLSVLDIPRSCGILSERELELTERYDATELLKKLAAGEVR